MYLMLKLTRKPIKKNTTINDNNNNISNNNNSISNNSNNNNNNISNNNNNNIHINNNHTTSSSPKISDVLSSTGFTVPSPVISSASFTLAQQTLTHQRMSIPLSTLPTKATPAYVPSINSPTPFRTSIFTLKGHTHGQYRCGKPRNKICNFKMCQKCCSSCF